MDMFYVSEDNLILGENYLTYSKCVLFNLIIIAGDQFGGSAFGSSFGTSSFGSNNANSNGKF